MEDYIIKKGKQLAVLYYGRSVLPRDQSLLDRVIRQSLTVPGYEKCEG